MARSTAERHRGRSLQIAGVNHDKYRQLRDTTLATGVQTDKQHGGRLMRLRAESEQPDAGALSPRLRNMENMLAVNILT